MECGLEALFSFSSSATNSTFKILYNLNKLLVETNTFSKNNKCLQGANLCYFYFPPLQSGLNGNDYIKREVDNDRKTAVVLAFVCLCCLRSSLEMFPRDVWLE